jgi:glutaconate CoA-transferase, subunit A
MAKLTSLRDAVASLIRDGDCVHAAGFTHLIPFAAGHEIIRHERKNVVPARATPDPTYDLMTDGGCARKVICSRAGNPCVDLLKGMRAEFETGRLEWEEYSHFSMTSRLTAGAVLRRAAESGGAR